MEETSAMSVDKNLPMGNAEDIKIDGDEVHFAAEKCGSPQAMWFGFRIIGAEGKQVTCVWEHTNEVLGNNSLGAAVPVYKPAHEDSFKRVPVSTCNFSSEQNRFFFQVPCDSDEVYVYYCYPYGPAELETFLKTIEESDFVTVITLTESAGGQPCKLIRLSDEHGSGDKKQIWVTARNHSGEVSGSFAMEGIIKEILANPDVLKKADIYFVPFVDTDGVWLGYYGKDRAPRDFNRDYCLNPIRPEVRAVLKAIKSFSNSRVDISFDLHAPTPGDPAYLVPPKLSIIHADDWKTYCRFAATMDEFSQESCPVRFSEFEKRGRMGSMSWTDGLNYDMTCTAFLYLAYGAISFTLEIPYHRGLGISGKVLKFDDWRELGRGLAKGIKAALDEELKELEEIPDMGIPILSRWRLVQPLRRATLSETDTTLEIAGVCDNSFIWFASNKVFEGAFKLDYELEGSLKRCELMLKEVGGGKALPTGRFETGALMLNAPRERLSIEAQTVDSFRILLKLEGLNGKLSICDRGHEHAR